MSLLDQFISLGDLEDAAERLLPRHIWDYIAGGSGDELTTRRNRVAFEQLALRPRVLRDVASSDLTASVLGTEISMPVFLSPAAFQTNVHPEGEAATARGAGMAGTLTIVPAHGSRRIEDVAGEATGPLWLQISHQTRETTEAFVQRAEAAGYRAIVMTVDITVQNPKTRDRRNWFLPPYAGVRYSLHEDPFPDIRLPGMPFTMSDLEWLRDRTSLPIVIKGVLTGDDARDVVDAGVAGVLVSNHAGRVLDGTLSTIESLPEVVEAVGGRAEVYLDSGIRRGTDVLKALAFGARAVGIGRPWYWGLAVAGPEGVSRVLEILRQELDVALALCGQTSARVLDPGIVSVPHGWGPGILVPAAPSPIADGRADTVHGATR